MPQRPRRLPCRSSSVIAVLVTLALVNCGPAEPRSEFRFLNSEPETLDPNRLSGQPGGRIALALLEGLVVRAPGSLRPVPGMATHWEVDAQGLIWTFHLREAVWSDGRPVSSEDFRTSWLRLLEPATAARYADILFPVRNARAFNAGQLRDRAAVGLSCPDDRTFVVELERPLPMFLDLCANPWLLPIPRHVVDRNGDAWIRPENLVGNGPFLLEEWRIHERIRLRRNPRYWNAGGIALETVEAIPIDLANTAFNFYSTGLLDWIDSQGVPLSIVDELQTREDWHAGPYLATWFLRCNVRRSPLDDHRVRKALYHAIDPHDITTFVTRGGQRPAHSLVPPGLPDYEEVQLSGHDPELARMLLTEAGFPAGAGFPAITLLFNTSESSRQICEVLQQQWKRTLGIEVQLQNQEFKVFQATVQAGDYDLSRGVWIGDYLDPNTFLEIWTSSNGNNRTGFADSRYDTLIAEAAHSTDEERRMRLLRQCERIVTAEECIVLPIYHYVVTNLYDEGRWAGLEPNLLNWLDLRHVRPRERRP